jgi:LuxR family transcriptional regulator, maltose regulon positive regulatory protein
MTMQAGDSRPVQIYVLGRFDIVLDGTPLRFVSKTPRKVLAVLKGLLCAGKRGVSQGTLQDALWPESESLLARRALNTSVYRLRRLLGRKEAIMLNDGWVALDPSVCWVDAWAFEQGISEPVDPAGLQSVLRLYGGMLLNDADHPLAYEARERLRRKYVQAVLHLGQAYERGGELSSAIALYENALDTDCTPEDVHRALMRCFAREGKPASVGAAYQRCRTMLWRHFATSPSAATEQIYREVCANPAPGFVTRVVSVTRPVVSRRNTTHVIDAMSHKMQG